MHPDCEQVLFYEEEIRRRVRELGEQISLDFKGKKLVVIGILKGSLIFLADLIRFITLPVFIDFISVSSYGKSTRSSGTVRILKDLDLNIRGCHVLLVEDIVDTGLTLNYLKDYMERRRPASFKICALLDKPGRRKVNVAVDYYGFSIPDQFVVGYGLDYNEYYRNLSFLMVLRPEVYEGGR